VNFGGKTDDEIRGLIQFYRDKGAPDVWFASLLSTPAHVREILYSLGLMDPSEADMNDQGMAIPPERMESYRRNENESKSIITVKRVANKEEFAI